MNKAQLFTAMLVMLGTTVGAFAGDEIAAQNGNGACCPKPSCKPACPKPCAPACPQACPAPCKPCCTPNPCCVDSCGRTRPMTPAERDSLKRQNQGIFNFCE